MNRYNLLFLLAFLAPSLCMAQALDRTAYDPKSPMAVGMNPAAIAHRRRFSVDLYFQHKARLLDSDNMTIGGAALSFRLFGPLFLGGQIITGYDDGAWSVGGRTGLGLALGRTWSLAVTGSFFRMHDARGIYHLNSLDLGVRSVPSRFLALGLSATNLNLSGQGRVPLTIRAGVGVRPWGDERFTIGFDAATAHDASRVYFDLASGIRLYKGIFLNLRFDTQYRPALDFGGLAGISLAFDRVETWAAGGWSASNQAETVSAGISIGPARVSTAQLLSDGWLIYDIHGLGMDCAGPVTIDCSLLDTLGDLDAISRMQGVRGVILRVGACPHGMGTAGLVAAAIQRLRARGVRVIVGMGMCGPPGFAAFAGADELYLVPGTASPVIPAGHRLVFLHDLLEKIGVKVDYQATGAYKTFPLMFTRSTPAPAQVNMWTPLLTQRCLAFVKRLNRLRGTKFACSNGSPPFFSAVRAKEAGLADGLAHLDKVVRTVTDRLGVSPVMFSRTRPATWHGLPGIAIIPVHGDIVPGRSMDLPFAGIHLAGAASIAGLVDRAAHNPEIAAILVFVDSPGGDLAASEVMLHAIKQARKAKPLAVLFGNTAASGGYYLSTGAGRIFTPAQAITGSIGVFLMRFSVLDLLSKLGIATFPVPKDRDVSICSLLSRLRPQDHKDMKALLKDAFGLFIRRVRQGRGEKAAAWAKQAGAMVVTGDQALKYGLADQVGGLGDALDYLKKQAGVSVFRAVVMRPPTLVERIAASFRPLARAVFHAMGDAAGAVLGVSLSGPVSARLPCVIMDR